MKLAYGEVLDSAWKSIRDDLPLAAALTAVFGFGVWVLNLVPFLGYLVIGPLSLGYIKCLQQIRLKQVIGYQDFLWAFLNFNRFLHAVLLSVLINFGMILGFILLLIPGIWFAVASCFSNVSFLFRKEDSIDAIKRSMEIVKNRWWNVFGFGMVLLMINLAGALCLFIGLLISAPVSALATIIAFERLSKTVQLPPREPAFQEADKDPAEVTILP